MISLFIRQYFSVILFVVALQLITNIILFLDSGFHDVSLFYINIVWLVLVVSYFSYRYVKDMKMMKAYTMRLLRLVM